MQRAKSEYAIQTVSNALRLLEAFDGKEDLGVTELAKRLLHRNHLFRLHRWTRRLGLAGVGSWQLVKSALQGAVAT